MKQTNNAHHPQRIILQIECSTTENQLVFSITPYSTSISIPDELHFTPVLKLHKTLLSTPELKHFPNLKRIHSVTHQINSEFKNKTSNWWNLSIRKSDFMNWLESKECWHNIKVHFKWRNQCTWMFHQRFIWRIADKVRKQDMSEFEELICMKN